MLTSNYLIINREPQQFSELHLEGTTLTFDDGNSLTLDETIYAALYCDEVRNVTLVVSKSGVQTVETILWCDEAGYLAGKREIETALGRKMSRQNKKLNRYGEEIAKKLDNGVQIQVIDAVEESAMVECPDCGMMSPKGTPFCMECGAELPM